MRNMMLALAAVLMLEGIALALPNVAALAQDGSINGQVVTVDRYYTSIDGGGGQFQWVSGSTLPPDNGIVFAGTHSTTFTDSNENGHWDRGEEVNGVPAQTYPWGTGRWIRITTGLAELSVRMFGAKGNGDAEDGDAIQRTIDAALNAEIATVRLNTGRYRISGTDPNNSPGPGQTLLKVDTDYYPVERGEIDPRGILNVGFQTIQTTKSFLKLVGPELTTEVATLFTDQADGDPAMLLVGTNVSNFEVRNIRFERNVTQKSWSLSRASNRPAIMITPNNNGDIDSITIRNVTFVECYRALEVLMKDSNFRDLTGRLLEFNVDGCTFLYPNGINFNIYPNQATERLMDAATAMNISPWVRHLRVTNCHFDGAVGGNVSNNSTKLQMDGFVYGGPVRATISGNTIKHFGFEGISLHSDNNFAATAATVTFSMPDPNSSGTIALPLATEPTTSPLYDWARNPVGLKVFVGTGIYGSTNPATGESTHLGYMEIVGTGTGSFGGSTRSTVILKNAGHPLNQPSSQTITLGAGTPIWYGAVTDQTKPYHQIFPFAASASLLETRSALINGNTIDGSKVIGTQATAYNGYGSPGIQIRGFRAAITDNRIVNCTNAISITDYIDDGIMDGSLIASNDIEMPDPNIVGLSTEYGLAGVTGIDANARGITIQENRILLASGAGAVGGSAGILVRDHEIRVIRNDLTVTDPGATKLGTGILLFGELQDCVLRGNRTTNFGKGIFGTGISATQSQVYTITDHNSVNDGQATPLNTGGTGKNQNLTFTATKTGWHRILTANRPLNASELFAARFDVRRGQSRISFLTRYYRLWDGPKAIAPVQVLPDGHGRSSAFAALLTGVYRPELFVDLGNEWSGEDRVSVAMETEKSGIFIDPVPGLQVQAVIGERIVGTTTETVVELEKPHDMRGATTVGDAGTWAVYVFQSPANGGKFLGSHRVKAPSGTTSAEQMYQENPLRIVIKNSGASSLSIRPGDVVFTANTNAPASGVDASFDRLISFDIRDGSVTPSGEVPIDDALPAELQKITPTFVGQIFFDSNSGHFYVGRSMTSGAWEKIVTQNSASVLQSLRLGQGMLGPAGISFADSLGGGKNGIFSDEVGSIGLSLNGELVMKMVEGAKINPSDPNSKKYGQMLMDSGTDDRPGYGFDGDENSDTGIFWKGENQIGFATGGEERASISNQGVTIGGGTPISAIKVHNYPYDFPAINAGTARQTPEITVPGVKSGDVILLSHAEGTAQSVIYSVLYVRADTLIIRAFNANSVQVDPGQATFRIVVMQTGN